MLSYKEVESSLSDPPSLHSCNKLLCELSALGCSEERLEYNICLPPLLHLQILERQVLWT